MKYKNLIILFKNNPSSFDGTDGGTYTIEFPNSVITVSGDFLIVTQHDEDGNSLTGKVFPLNIIHSYKANKE